jgi:nucleoside-diphosphate-sugar epimerase
MKILFTGASSFTGYWFARTLSEAGHQIICIFTASSANDYTDVRSLRVNQLLDISDCRFGVAFGDERFMEMIKTERFDLLCHHAACVKDYKEASFDVAYALQQNTNNVYHVLKTLAENDCKKMILTGSVFEGGEGKGSDNLPHFSPYGLSKALTAQIFAYYAQQFGMAFGKFVIPNPFGPFEEKRFTAYLMRNWMQGAVPQIGTPDYVRDNIPVGLLALYYKHFCEHLEPGSLKKISPTGIADSQGNFAAIVANEVSQRLNIPCEFTCKIQSDFSEPMIRLNTDRMQEVESQFDASAFWDQFAAYYKQYGA